jgi:hypothetical protein
VRRNQEAAVLAVVAGILLILTGYTGVRSIERLDNLLVEFFGPNPVFRILALVLFGIASFGGFSVILGGFLIWHDHVRFGRSFILVGSGAGFFTLVLFLLVNLRREEFSFLANVLPTVFGVAIGVAARLRAVPRPIRKILRPS